LLAFAVVKVVVALTVFLAFGVGGALKVALAFDAMPMFFGKAGLALAVIKVVVALTVFLALGVGRAVEAVTAPVLDAESNIIRLLSIRTLIFNALFIYFVEASLALAVIKGVVTLTMFLALGVGWTDEVVMTPILYTIAAAIWNETAGAIRNTVPIFKSVTSFAWLALVVTNELLIVRASTVVHIGGAVFGRDQVAGAFEAGRSSAVKINDLRFTNKIIAWARLQLCRKDFDFGILALDVPESSTPIWTAGPPQGCISGADITFSRRHVLDKVDLSLIQFAEHIVASIGIKVGMGVLVFPRTQGHGHFSFDVEITRELASVWVDRARSGRQLATQVGGADGWDGSRGKGSRKKKGGVLEEHVGGWNVVIIVVDAFVSEWSKLKL